MVLLRKEEEEKEEEEKETPWMSVKDEVTDKVYSLTKVELLN